jgi:GTP-binding protein
VLALSKVDLVTPEIASEAVARWSARLGDSVAVVATSSATGEGLDALRREILRVTPSEPASVPAALDDDGYALAEHKVFRPAARRGFQVQRTGERSFRVQGEGIERLLSRHDLDNQDAMAYVEGRLRRIGVLRALESEGFAPGDAIEIAGVVFELDPGAPA